MTVTDASSPLQTQKEIEPVVALHRRTIDLVLIGIGALATIVLLVAGGLLTWGRNFSANYVRDELTSQRITFPSADELTAEGRTDLLEFADEPLTTGSGAQAYASYIDGHLQGIAEGATYADLGTPERTAKAAVTDAIAAGEPEADIRALEATATGVTAQRDAMFKGETLRGLLLSAYAWSTVGRIAGIASVAAFVAAALMLVFVALGVIHHRRMTTAVVPTTTVPG
jgi:hypothetical protein